MIENKWQYYLNLLPEEIADRDREDEDITLPLGKGNLDYLEDCEKVIDLGCGTGVVLDYYLNKRKYAGYEKRKNIYGITINQKEKDIAFQKYGDSVCERIMTGDVHDLYMLKDKEFDGAIMWEILEHTLSPIIALWECNRVLKDNGKLVLMIPNKIYTDFPWHVYTSNYEQTKSLLKKAGFVIEDFKDLTGDSGRYWCKKVCDITSVMDVIKKVKSYERRKMTNDK